MRIAVVQHRLRPTPADDAAALADAATRAVSGGADVVVLPAVLSLGQGPAVSDDAGSSAALGSIAVLVGDACISADALIAVRAEAPETVVMCPGAENDLQAESFLEVAIALSDSLAGLVVVAECVGAEPGEPGHGGSAIVMLGEVMAEALGDDDILFADIVTPVVRPEPLEPLPEIPPLLRQRLALHAGRKLEVPGYPADIT